MNINDELLAQAEVRYSEYLYAASPNTTYLGSIWYQEGQAICRELALEHGITLEQAATVLAAFSPMTPWDRNVFLATEFINGRKVATLGNNIRMAEAGIVGGIATLKGKKTNAFARNLSGDLDAVTIDTWMIKAAGIVREPGKKKGINDTEYNTLALALTKVADANNMPPAVVQAIIWISIRGKAD